ncbi:MAG: M20 family metallo-hydrolase [Planctomycetota bacterium]
MPGESAFTRAARRIEALEPEMVAFQSALTALPALSPQSGGEGEWDKALFIQEALARFGISRIERIDAPDARVKNGARPNLVATLPGRRRDAFWIMAHMDVVPPGERSLWKTDPWTAVVEEGRIYGRGTEDNQQGLTAAVFAARALTEEGILPGRNLRLLFCADEESNSVYGLQYILAHHRGRFSESDLILAPDWGSPDGSRIEIAEKGMLWLRFTTHGMQCHASRPDKGVNAFRAASDLVVRLNGLHERFPASDPLFEPRASTFEPTMKEPNVSNLNTIPGKDVFYFDCRVMPAYDTDAILKAAQEIARSVEEEHGVTIELSTEVRMEAPAPTPGDAAIVRGLVRAVEEVHGLTPSLSGIGGNTVAGFFRAAGLPAAVWSTMDGTAHQPNEYTVIANMVRDAKVFAHLALEA